MTTPPPNDPLVQHVERMKDLVRFTASSLDTDFPSPFGSAVYNERNFALVAEAYDTVLERGDPTDHAEINAIRESAKKLRRLSLQGCTLYSTCEPCPMCMSACIWAEVDTVVYGASTLEDAERYWPQALDLSPDELVARMRREPRTRVISAVERALCQELFTRCDDARRRRGLPLPPHR